MYGWMRGVAWSQALREWDGVRLLTTFFIPLTLIRSRCSSLLPLEGLILYFYSLFFRSTAL